MRLLRVVSGWSLILLLLMLLGIHIYAEIFRWQAEHLLTQLKTLRVEETPAVTVLKLRSKYASGVYDSGPCTEDHCAFAIDLTEWKSLTVFSSKHPWSYRTRDYLVGGLRFFGLRLNSISANLHVENGKLRRVDVWFIPMSYRNGFLSAFSLHGRTVGKFSGAGRQLYAHPNLLVWEPTACTGCSGAMFADFTWQASQEEVERALGFDLSCITRFRDCNTSEEFFPTAAQVLEQDRAQFVDMRGEIPCDIRTARILGRDSDGIGIVRVKKVETAGSDTIVDYDLVQTLKGKSLPVSGSSYGPKEFADTVKDDGSSHSLRSVVRVGTERIIFLSGMLGQLRPEPNCAILAPTMQNFDAVAKGITDDRVHILDKEQP